MGHASTNRTLALLFLVTAHSLTTACGSGSEAESIDNRSTADAMQFGLQEAPDLDYVGTTLRHIRTLETIYYAENDTYLQMANVGYRARCADETLGFFLADCRGRYVFSVELTAAGFTARATSPFFRGFSASIDENGNTTGLPIVVTVSDVTALLGTVRTLEMSYFAEWEVFAPVPKVGAGTASCTAANLGLTLSQCPVNGVSLWVDIAAGGDDFLAHVTWNGREATVNADGTLTGL